jgi:DNA-binding XRE family transcriptional regulator
VFILVSSLASNLHDSRREGMTQASVRNPHLHHSAESVCGQFGLRLRELRKERNLTQAEMADRFGIDRSFISDVERGRKSLSLETLSIIALGMQMSLSQLFSGITSR